MRRNADEKIRGGGAWRMFTDALKSLLAPAVLGGAGMSAVMLFLLLERFKYIKGDVIVSGSFYILEDAMSWLFSAFGVGMALLLGVLAFRFLTNKQMVNVYASFGVKRKTIYLSRLGAGALLLCVMYFIPMAIALGMNLKYYGAGKLLLRAWWFLLAGFLLQGLFAFACSAAVSVMVGTLAEGVVFSAFLLNLPLILQYCVYTLARPLLWGSAMGVASNNAMVWYSGGGLKSPVYDFESVSPVLFMERFIRSCGVGRWDVEHEVMLGPIGGQYCEVPQWYALAGWLIALALAVLLGVLLFQRRKMEIAGFLGKNRMLNALFVFGVCFAMFSTVTAFAVRYLPFWAAALLGALSMALLFCGLQGTLLRNRPLFFRSLVSLPGYLLAATACAVIVYTGGLGYETRVPAAEEIERVSVTLPNKADYLGGVNLYQPSRSSSGSWASSAELVDSALLGIHSERDLRLVQSLHRQAIGLKKEYRKAEDDGYVAFDLVYTLKDGSMVKRHYQNLPVEFWRKVLELNTSDRAGEGITQGFTQAYKEQPLLLYGTEDELRQNFLKKVSYGTDRLTLRSGADSREYRVNLAEEAFWRLKRCLASDLTRQTVEQRWFPQEGVQGYLVFHPTLDASRPLDSLLQTGLDTVWIPVTADMSETLEFCRENGLFEHFKPKLEVGQAWVIRAEDYWKRHLVSFGQMREDMLFEFECKQYGMGSDSPLQDALIREDILNVTGKEAIAGLEKAARGVYFDSRDGYYVLFRFTDGTGVSGYLPADKVTPGLKEAFQK